LLLQMYSASSSEEVLLLLLQMYRLLQEVLLLLLQMYTPRKYFCCCYRCIVLPPPHSLNWVCLPNYCTHYYTNYKSQARVLYYFHLRIPQFEDIYQITTHREWRRISHWKWKLRFLPRKLWYPPKKLRFQFLKILAFTGLFFEKEMDIYIHSADFLKSLNI